MSAERLELTADSARALAATWIASRQQRQPVFWLALSCAVLLHAALIFGIVRSQPRYVGDLGGNAGAIDVELVNEHDLENRMGGSAPSAIPMPAPEQTAPPPVPPTPAPQPEAAPAESAPAAQAAPELRPTETEIPDLSAAPAPEKAKPSESVGKEAKREPEKPAEKRDLKPPSQLDLSLPFNMTMQGGGGGGEGRSSAVSRPPGVTRSGENDKFGHDVIGALKKTMPPARGAKGRVVIRFLLDERGNLASVKLVQSAGNADLDQSVVFAAHQTSFPFPPKNSTVADRTFLITYTYR